VEGRELLLSADDLERHPRIVTALARKANRRPRPD
jgi:hypothetical protein